VPFSQLLVELAYGRLQARLETRVPFSQQSPHPRTVFLGLALAREVT
jgi:hypothetical protein